MLSVEQQNKSSVVYWFLFINKMHPSYLKFNATAYYIDLKYRISEIMYTYEDMLPFKTAHQEGVLQHLKEMFSEVTSLGKK